MASRSASTATATASSSVTIPTGPSPNSSRENNRPPSWDAPWKPSASSKSPAYSPQAKGRIERAWRTCQDRLVSELRLAGATTLEQANAVLQRFCADYNQRFARPAAQPAGQFRRLPRGFISPAAWPCATNASSPPTIPSP